jgi:hypothetical protein
MFLKLSSDRGSAILQRPSTLAQNHVAAEKKATPFSLCKKMQKDDFSIDLLYDV